MSDKWLVMRSGRGRAAFTIFELLVTLSIIAAFSAVAIAGFQLSGHRRALDSAQSSLHALLKVARSQAILNGQDARLIINFDANDPERYLRYAGIVVREDFDSDNWQAVHRGMTFPEGIYVVPQDGATFVNWNETEDSDRKSEYKQSQDEPLNSAVMNLVYPANDLKEADINTDPEWIAFEFGADGRLDRMLNKDDGSPMPSGSSPNNNHISLASGSYSQPGVLVFEDSSQVKGIRLRQNGHTYVVNDPDGL